MVASCIALCIEIMSNYRCWTLYGVESFTGIDSVVMKSIIEFLSFFSSEISLCGGGEKWRKGKKVCSLYRRNQIKDSKKEGK